MSSCLNNELEPTYERYKLYLNEGLSNKEALNKLHLPYKSSERKYIKERIIEDAWLGVEPIYSDIEERYVNGEGLIKICNDYNINPNTTEYNVINDKLKEKNLKKETKPYKRKKDDATEKYEELFKQYKKLFETTTLPIKKIYEKIGVTNKNAPYKYIRKRCKEEGLSSGERRKNHIKNSKNRSPMNVEALDYDMEVYEMMDESEPLLEKMFRERNVKSSTSKGYLSSFIKYCDYTKSKYGNLQDMLDIYIREENDRIPSREKTIKHDLLGFREYLLDQKESSKNIQSTKTAMTYFSKIKSIFYHFGIEIPKLPQVKIEKGYVSNFNDLPTHNMIMRACEQSPLDLKAILLFMSSSGTAKAETLSITVEMFLNGCSEYLTSVPSESNIKGVLKELSDKHDIVPLIYLRRIKTDKYYFTCCSPEASYMIIEYLNTRKSLCLTDKLFDFTSSMLLEKFQTINDNNGWGFVGAYRRFRSHTLRKFMASNIGLSRDQVDSLQGRSKDEIQEAYFKQNPKQLKKIYMDAMHRVMIYNNWGHGTTSDELNNPNYNIVNSPGSDECIVDLLSVPLNENDIKESIQDTEEVSTPVNYNPLLTYDAGNMMPVIPINFSVAEELLKYSELMDKGLLNVGEFNLIKQKLLGSVLR